MLSIKRYLLAAALLAAASGAQAADEQPYTAAAFSQLSSEGRDVVIDVHADWCSTCQRQRPALEALVHSDKYKDFTILVVNYDTQIDVMKQFKVSARSTLIVFHGTQERGRATGITAPDQIAALLDKGLQ